MKEYFLYTGISIPRIIPWLYREAAIESNYYLSPVGVFRCDVSKELRAEIEKIVKLPIADCGFLKRFPKSIYPTHVDKYRICAINMPMSDPDSNFYAYSFNGIQRIPIEYKKDHLTILNVMKLHGVINNSDTNTRTILSIGLQTTDYFSCIKKFCNREILYDTL